MSALGPSRLAPEVDTWPLGDRIVLWHRITGRHVALARETFASLDDPAVEAVRRRLARVGLLGGSMPWDPRQLVPVRSRLVLLRPDGPSLWYPVPSMPTPGGHALAERRLDRVELAIWQAINDHRYTGQVADAAGVPVERVLAFLRTLTTPDVQAVQLRDQPPSPRDGSLWHLVAPERPLSPRPADQRGMSGETTLLAYHLAIEHGDRHFDDHETTVAHALGLPHPALGGRRYGEALRDALRGRGMLPEAGLVLEVGCGDGELAQAFTDGLTGPRYARADLSPELLRTQRVRVPSTSGVLADAVRLPFRDGCVDLLVSNEVIADLCAVRADAEGPAAEAVRDRIDRYGLEARPGLFNLGAWQLVEEVARLLAPGGAAFLSEFGELDLPPEEAVQLDHPEVAIHFGELLAVAHALGLTAEVVRLDELLGVDLSARHLARPHHEALRAMVRAEGGHLPARSWTPEQLREALPWPVEGLAWVPVSEPGPGPLVTRFQALLIRR